MNILWKQHCKHRRSEQIANLLLCPLFDLILFSLSLSFAFFSADVSAHFSLLPFYTPGTKLCSHAILTHIILFFRQINYPTNCIYFSVPISFTIFSAPYTIGALALYLSFTYSVSICVLLCVCVCAPLCDKGFLLFCKRFKSPKAMQTL